MEKVMGIGDFFTPGLGRMSDDQIVSGFGGYFFDACQYGADELAFELMYDDADGMGLLHPQVACETIGAVAHFLRGVHDAFARLDINGRMIF